MYRSAYEAYNRPRYLKAWGDVCVPASEQYEVAAWRGPAITTANIVKVIRANFGKRDKSL